MAAMFCNWKIRYVALVTFLLTICFLQPTFCSPDKGHRNENGGEIVNLVKRLWSWGCLFGYCAHPIPIPTTGDSLWLKISDIMWSGAAGGCHMIFTDTAGKKSQELVVPQNITSLSEVVSFEMIKQNSNEKYFFGTNFSNMGDIEKMEIWTKAPTISIPMDKWNPELVTIKKHTTGETVYFPISRWLEGNTPRTFYKYDIFLPQSDPLTEFRKEDLNKARALYEYRIHEPVSMPRIKETPDDETFSGKYAIDMALNSTGFAGTAILKTLTKQNRPWDSYQEMIDVYAKKDLKLRYANMNFKDDEWFARSRLQGANPGVIRLATEIPIKFKVTTNDIEDLLKKYDPNLEDCSIENAIDRKKLFIIDYKDLEPLQKKYKVPTPFALFYLDSSDVLRPVAIQLYQEPSARNPVFTPNDYPNVWLLAKLWFHVADSSYHQSIAHLGLTHFLIEGIIVATHRTLNLNHPLFKLMKPHFLFTIAANDAADLFVTKSGGLADMAMTITGPGLLDGAQIGLKNYNMARDGMISNKFKEQGVTADILPEYPYRDDIIAAWDITREYVSSILHLYYKNEQDLKDDKELKAWRLELSRQPKTGDLKGIGIKGVPGDDIEGFNDLDEVIDTAAVVIVTASFQHAAINCIQFEWYAFAPNQPNIMNKEPPTSRENITEKYVLSALPNVAQFMSMAFVAKILGTRKTNTIGFFEIPRFYSPEAKKVVEKFQEQLTKLGESINEKNKNRPHEYPFLHPESVPNSITI